MLNKMGARVQGAGTSVITIEGVDELQPIEHAIMPDRIEAGTFMVAAALTRGDVLLRDCLPEHLDAVIAKLRVGRRRGRRRRRAGCACAGAATIQPVDITTQPYPGFPTDMQAQFMVLATRARGQSVITETIFENRYMHVQELARMGADIHVDGRTAVVRGVKKLTGAKVMATDLRASAALILAGLVAEGTTEVLRVYHLDRGYERIEKKLASSAPTSNAPKTAERSPRVGRLAHAGAAQGARPRRGDRAVRARRRRSVAGPGRLAPAGVRAAGGRAARARGARRRRADLRRARRRRRSASPGATCSRSRGATCTSRSISASAAAGCASPSRSIRRRAPSTTKGAARTCATPPSSPT